MFRQKNVDATVARSCFVFFLEDGVAGISSMLLKAPGRVPVGRGGAKVLRLEWVGVILGLRFVPEVKAFFTRRRGVLRPKAAAAAAAGGGLRAPSFLLPGQLAVLCSLRWGSSSARRPRSPACSACSPLFDVLCDCVIVLFLGMAARIAERGSFASPNASLVSGRGGNRGEGAGLQGFHECIETSALLLEAW